MQPTLKDNVLYVIRYCNTEHGGTVNTIGDSTLVRDLQSDVRMVDIRVWELETNDLKRVNIRVTP